MNKPKTPAPNFVSPLPRNYGKPMENPTPEAWAALLLDNEFQEAAQGHGEHSYVYLMQKGSPGAKAEIEKRLSAEEFARLKVILSLVNSPSPAEVEDGILRQGYLKVMKSKQPS